MRRPVPDLELVDALPPPAVIPDALALIRSYNTEVGTRLMVLDDDPTGSQTVHDVPILTLENTLEEIARTVCAPHPAVFVLTNSRALTAVAARELAARLWTAAHARADGLDLRVVSRSDSTLRGHFQAETDALTLAAARAGTPYDGVLLCPAFLEAGRLTIDDVQWVRQGGSLVPADQTEYARDATFGYTEPTLPAWVTARTGRPVSSLSLAELRTGGVDHVTARLREVRDGLVLIANAADDADLEVVCLALQRAEADGTRLLYRTGPSFVRVRAGLAARAPLTTPEIYPDGGEGGPGLLVVGSHTDLTTRQLSVARTRHRLAHVELNAALLAAGDTAEADRCVHRLRGALATGDTALSTTRARIEGTSPEASLRMAVRIAAAVVDVVARSIDPPPRFLVAKGGITSAEIATKALRVRRATVLGQLAPGRLSVWRPLDGRAPGLPYVVFPGNVGDDASLTRVLDVLKGTS